MYVVITMMTVTLQCVPHCLSFRVRVAAVDDASLEGEDSATDWSESSETGQSSYSSDSDLEQYSTATK